MARLMVVCAVALAFAPPSWAQVYTGRIDVTVTDSTGAVLPGATVDLSGPQTTTSVTDASGEAHFLGLPPGIYVVAAKLTGFNEYLNKNVAVTAGGSVPLKVSLNIGGVTQQVDVTSESPVIDKRKQTTSTSVTLDELQNIPSSRDPWVVMQTVPGIIVDRVNVGGAESGQQSNYQAKGASGGENTWNIDGIPITDMAATGASPTYYDFDMFQEMQVTTGGADVANPTPGVQLNFVLKSGSNTPHGSTRGYFSNQDMQANNLPSDLKTSVGGTTGKGNRTDQYSDYGAELGGPIMRDKWWAWGSWGKTDVRIRTLNDVLDRTILENIGFKTQAQLTTPLRTGFTFFRGDKIKNGRGASVTRPQETTWNQSGPTSIYKGEANWVVSNSLFLTARGAYSDMGFTLDPIGGRSVDVYRDVSRTWHNSFVYYSSNRPQHAALAEGSYFRGRHELKFGFSWRKAVVDSISSWPGSKQYSIHLGNYPTTGRMLPIFTRDQVTNTEGRYVNAFLGDTISLNRMTLNVGARIDHSSTSTTGSFSEGSPIVPDVLPDLRSGAIKNPYSFTTLTPRLGLTYALDENRKTLARASYSMFASQLGAAEAAFVAGPLTYSYVYYIAVDSNRDGVTQAGELVTGALGSYGFDLDSPTDTSSVNRVGSDLHSARTHEFLLGLDRELLPNFGVSGTFTYRRFNDLRWKPVIGVRQGDYVLADTITGNLDPIGQFSAPVYEPREGVLPRGNGREDLNRDGYHQRYWGFEFSATKRMANRWMMRLGFSTNDHREYFDNPDTAIEDPTRFPTSPKVDGGVVVRETGGSGKSAIFMILPKYQFIANGLYQGRWGVNFGANLVTRQGFGMPYFAGDTEVNDPSAGGLKDVLVVSDVDDQRLPAVTSLDLRLEKGFRINRANLNFDLDLFNVTNSNTVLGRQFDINATGDSGFDKVLEIMNPRILRLGVRVNF